MIKLGILFQEDEMEHKDLSRPELGNPGVGGTAFCFLLLIRYLQDHRDQIDLTVYQIKENKLPDCRAVMVPDTQTAFLKAAEDGLDMMLVRNHQTDRVYEEMTKSGLSFIIWMHNKLTWNEIRLLDRFDAVRRIVCVGREMYDYYLDDPVIRKMDVVSNMFVPPSEEMIRSKDYPLWVTYTGSLTYDKNFHLLAAVWKNIVKEVPDAQLHVIGSGRLYDPDSKMGAYGIAESEYEAMFMPALCDENGEILSSVIFHGILGEEKYEIYRKSAVGVLNPMATETFCLAAIEKEACGVPVVSRRKNGLLDTVQDGKTGILYRKIERLEETILKLLKDRELNERMGKEALEFARNEFLPEKIMPEWIRVFREVKDGIPAVFRHPKANLDNNGKRIRLLWHGLHQIPFLRWIPSIHDLQKK